MKSRVGETMESIPCCRRRWSGARMRAATETILRRTCQNVWRRARIYEKRTGSKRYWDDDRVLNRNAFVLSLRESLARFGIKTTSSDETSACRSQYDMKA